MRINASKVAKFLAAALLTAAGAAGCVKFSPATTDKTDSTPRRVEFPTPIVSPVTKADAGTDTEANTDEGVANLEEYGFGVFGLWYPDEFSGWESTPGAAVHIDGDGFFYDGGAGSRAKGGTWISDPAHYWLPMGKMAFAAWSPYDIKESEETTLSYGATGLTIKDFDTQNGERDLMYSERVYDKTSSQGSNPTYDGIDLVFHHALAALKFTTNAEIDRSSGWGKGDGSGTATPTVTTVTLTSIELWGFDRKGNFSENVDETTPLTYASAPQWSDVGTRYTEDDPLVIELDEMSAYIIPQQIPSEAKIRIYYTVQIGDNPPLPSVSQPLSLSGSKITGTEDILASWDMGKRYVYHITVTSAVMIRFSVDITPWHEGTDSGTGGGDTDITD